MRPKAEWVKDLTGWQRIVLKSQFGEDHYTFKDLPTMFEAGHRHGIDTLFLFAWWKDGMDRAYPKYEEPYPGAWAELKAGIAEVRRRGGRVILECNCHMVDPASDFYKAHGKDVLIRTINGDEHRPSFVYPGFGEFLPRLRRIPRAVRREAVPGRMFRHGALARHRVLAA